LRNQNQANNEKNKLEIELGGHTDNVGADDVNLRLSQQRA
jgi:outer membrane protein OmpA-like peptidoglycan-associated protein